MDGAFPQRKIIHIDMDAFYASVEQRDHPEFRGKPVVVGGSPQSRGVVCAASYEARTFGIRSAIPCATAYRLCPEAVFVRPRFDVYKAVSQEIRRIFFHHTDLVEPLSLDEAFLDVTDNKSGNPSATWLANEIRAQILKRTDLTASAGVAPNKFLAKIASDINKPNGICVIPPTQAEAFIEQLPIGKFFGIGKATEKRMHALEIFKGADLKRFEEVDLIRLFGKAGAWYYRIARGIDTRPVKPHREAKSIGVEETFRHDIDNLAQLEHELDLIAQELARRLQKRKTRGKTITLKLRYDDFSTITRSGTQAQFMNDAESLAHVAKSLLRNSEAGQRKVRLLGITVSNLANRTMNETSQLLLPFGEDTY
ncbi:DNA polymerase IV [Acanthopleuribacter pedis]|uniref:DNA polymerase IV n=1 Tax=Acanthopleuribacter pedis TaxID=442870 RepID=A0A8J7U549_9BACT|nr:DNA polymerase IV [Acanthopleuribacter pedis]MBO1321332.1 DNA polymerase IV [Acanthopleuribacter pedis]